MVYLDLSELVYETPLRMYYANFQNIEKGIGLITHISPSFEEGFSTIVSVPQNAVYLEE